MFERDVARMLAFKDISDADIQAIQAPALIINGDAEVVRAEHALELSRALPHAQLVILPGGHGDYIGEICAVDKHSQIPALVTAMIEAFLKGRPLPQASASVVNVDDNFVRCWFWNRNALDRYLPDLFPDIG